MKKLHYVFCIILVLLFTFNLPVPVSALHGDVTQDNTVTIQDAVIALRFATGIQVPDNEQKDDADMDGDNKITTEDVRRIIRGAAKIDIITDHIFSEWKITKEPTCSDEGLKTRFCIHCGKENREVIEKKKHNIIPATCQKGEYCSVCNEILGAPLEHEDVDGYCKNCNQCLIFAVLTYKNTEIPFGCNNTALEAELGKPQQILKDTSADKTFEMYIYYTDYTDLAVFTFSDGKLIQFYSIDTSSGFSIEEYDYSYSLEDDRKNNYINSYSVGNMYQDNFSLDVYVDTLSDSKPYAINLAVNESYTYSSSTDFSVNCLLNLYITNGLRALNKIEPLEYCNNVAKVAEGHSKDMATNNYFDHTNLDGLSSSQRITAGGIDWSACGENIAAGYDNAYYVADGWYNSSGHRSNLLNSRYEYLGVGIAYDSDSTYGYYSTQNFYKPAK